MASNFYFRATVFSFLVLIISLCFNLGYSSRILNHNKGGRNSISSNQILHELGFHDVLKYQQQRPIWIHGIGSDRISPGGPDSQHHYAQPPTLN